ncbi:MAG: hypothetical protein PHD43_08170 [Methylococcales bacterium]|nr:hypothetical protein [Methylococcales bacterium]
MTFSNISDADVPGRERTSPSVYPESIQTQASAVSWGAILAGAAAAAALALILLMLGTGLGLSSVSPWAYSGVSATTFGVSTILWLTFTQLVASGMGGYLAGRLRTKWVAVHTDEVYFRDTAHGFLSWAVAALATAALLTSVIGSIVSVGIQAGATVAGGVATATAVGSEMAMSNSDSGSIGYFVDSLFRKDIYAAPAGSGVLPGGTLEPTTAGSSASEVTKIFMNSIRTGPLPAEDIRYVGQIVSLRTGLTQQDAEKRVSDTYARVQTKLRDAETVAKEAADKGRKASAYAALWLFISLLIGAFVASFAATVGGRQRDM